jgi:hypothetical protein
MYVINTIFKVFPSTTYPLVPMTVDTQQVLVASKSGGLEEYIRSGVSFKIIRMHRMSY